MIKVKLFCNWDTSQHLHESWCKLFTPKGEGKWNNIQAVTSGQEAHYHIVFNFPRESEAKEVVPEKTIIFHMEPQGWRDRMYPKEWNPPSRTKYRYLADIANHGMVAEWHLKKSYDELIAQCEAKEDLSTQVLLRKSKTLSTVMSGATTLPGQKLRRDFIAYLEKIPDFEFWGKDASSSACYKGSLPPHSKDEGLLPYKYTYAAENSVEAGYHTEKLFDGILCECLVFYGNSHDSIEKLLHPQAYMRIDIGNPQEAYKTIIQAIKNDEYSKRLPYIREAKKKILQELHPFARIQTIIAKMTEEADFFNARVSCYYINLDRSKDRREKSEEQFRLFGIKGQRWPATLGRTLNAEDLIAQGLITADHSERNNLGVLGYIDSNVRLWRHISSLGEEKRYVASLGEGKEEKKGGEKLHLILDDDFHLHPRLMSLFPAYYSALPTDRQLVYFGLTSPMLNGPHTEQSLLPYVQPLNAYVARNTDIVQGSFAYAITSSCAKILLAQLPLSRPVDYFSPQKLTIYSLRRPRPLDVNMDFYLDRSTWEGRHTIVLHGLISVREEVSTINHVNPEAQQPLIKEIMEHRFNGHYEEAYKLLQEVKKNFHYYDEMSVVAYHIGKEEEGREALRTLVRGYPKYKKAILHYYDRVRENLRAYDLKEEIILLAHTLAKEREDKEESKAKKYNIQEARMRSPSCRTLVTACNSKFFSCARTQIASAHRYSIQDFDVYLVFDLGLSEAEVAQLCSYYKVRVQKMPEPVNDVHDFKWKLTIFNHLCRGAGSFFYLDAGGVFLGNINEIFYIIESQDIFLCEDYSQYNYTWTAPHCTKIMKATDPELMGHQLCAGITGWKGGGKYVYLLQEAYRYGKAGCLQGDYTHDYGLFHGKPIRGHRHDQSILSILKERYSAPVHDVRRYGAWDGYEQSKNAGALICVHRGGYSNFEGLMEW